MIGWVRGLLRFLLVANWIAAICFVLLAGVMLSGAIDVQLTPKFGADAQSVRNAMVLLLALGAMVAVPVHVIFARLIAMIDTVRSGRPFTVTNAARLRQIAWAVLAIQIADLGFGAFALWVTRVTDQTIGWQFSLTGWLSVLLLFVLAGVFGQGAAMQDELEGTV